MVARTSLLSELVLATIKKSWHHWKLALNLPPIRCWVNERVVGNFTKGFLKFKLGLFT
jgi:hypothetical protein